MPRKVQRSTNALKAGQSRWTNASLKGGQPWRNTDSDSKRIRRGVHMLGDTVVKGKQREKSSIQEKKQKRSKNVSSLPGSARTEALWITPSREQRTSTPPKMQADDMKMTVKMSIAKR